jgi:probable aminopeptidase NPEPL1
MTTIRFTKSLPSLLKGADSLLIVGTARAFEDGAFLEALPEDLMRLALDLASDTRPGDLGLAAGTLTQGAPRKLAIGVLPDGVSRHNSPARAESIRRVVAQSRTGTKGKAAILLVLDDAEHYPAAACAIARALPLYSAKSGKRTTQPKLAVMAIGPDDKSLGATPALQATVLYQREAARLVDMPPTELNPKAMQAEAWRLTRGLEGVRRRAIVGSKLLEEGLGGLHAVGRTAVEAPRLLVLTYTPGRKSARHIALVGKGITFDTGGLSLKVGGGMVGMKSDMGGAAAVLGAFCSLARAGCKHKVSALLCLAENAIGPTAFKVDDVITFHSGLTVEINNTDAEGRLVLADGVSYAARKLKVDTVIDAATLTGAQLVATGKLHAGVVANTEALEQTLIETGRATGDLVHPLPFAPEFYKAELRSAVADMRNSVSDRMNAQSSCAAQFVYWHLHGTDVSWGHVDMAGPSMVGKRASGFGVALLSEAVRSL